MLNENARKTEKLIRKTRVKIKIDVKISWQFTLIK